MRTASRHILVLIVIVASAAGVSACGGSGSGKVVAQIDGAAPVTEAMLKHWIPVEAAVLYQEVPKGPVPAGVLPDPPSFSSCIAFLKAHPKVAEISSRPSEAQVKARCEQELHKLTDLTLNTLIDWNWYVGAGEAAGIKVTQGEVKRRYVEANRRLFPNASELRAYMKNTGQTLADMMFRAKVQLFEVKLQERQAAQESKVAQLPVKEREAALIKLIGPPNKQWAEKTSCLPAFVTSACKQYKGSEAPGYPN